MIFTIVKKSILEQLRSPVVLLLTLITAPFFVILYALFFPSDIQTYDVLVQSSDSSSIVEYMSDWSPYDEEPILHITRVSSRDEGVKKLKDGDYDLMVIIPSGFSDSLDEVTKGEREQAIPFRFIGDLSNQRYSVGVIMAYSAIDAYCMEVKGIKSPIYMTEEAIGKSDKLNELDMYIPGLLIFSLIILIFQVSMSLSRLVEGGILKRLILTKASTFQILIGYSLSIIIFGLLSFVLTLITATLCGSTLSGNWLLVGVVTTLIAMAITGTGMIVSALSPTVSGAFILANFPLMLYMFFSGAIYPIGKIEIFKTELFTVGLFDILPTTHGVQALHKLLVLQGSVSDILFELISLTLLTLIYLFIGVRLYYKRHIKI